MTGEAAYDVAILSDFRYPGGTSASVVEEVRAQANAGLSTVLVHVPSPHLKSVRSFSPRVADCLREGIAHLSLPGERVSARLLVIRQPRIFTAEPDPPPRVRGDQTVMVINQAARDLDGDREYYDPLEIRWRVESLFGDRIHWTPIGPLVRNQLSALAPSIALHPADWHNVIDVDAWQVDRSAPVANVPVIGRHGRADIRKWPRTREEILQAYPSSDDFKVRILGGGELAADRIGTTPGSWEILPFGSQTPQEFLRTIDYFVYFHDPDIVEAFGRSILEAMASGLPTILPSRFEALFGEAAIYARPEQVQELVRSLHKDWHRYCQISEEARTYVKDRFGYQAHIARLRELGLEEKAKTAAPTPDSRSSSRLVGRMMHATPASQRAARILMLSSNGYGLGHVTRLMAIARRMPEQIQTVIATQSQAAPIVQQAGFLTEYIPSSGYLGIAADRWNILLHERLCHLINLYRPHLVAVDGTAAYTGLLKTIADHPNLVWVWVRRAMWKRGLGEKWIERGRAFDFVLEPGEFAATADEGVTVGERPNAHVVGPITYFDTSELLEADAARQALELGSRPAALLQLGSGRDLRDARSLSGRAAAYLRGRGFQVVLARSPIEIEALEAPADVRVVERYPLSQYLRAFELVISAAGYNAFHELVGSCVPAVFCPQPGTPLDDQEARVRYAMEVGAGLGLSSNTSEELDDVLARAVRPEVRDSLAQRCAELALPNGAAEAANYIAALTRSNHSYAEP